MSLLTWSVGDKEPCCWGRHSDSLQVVWLKSPLNVTVPLSPGASMLQHPDFPFVLEQFIEHLSAGESYLSEVMKVLQQAPLS